MGVELKNSDHQKFEEEREITKESRIITALKAILVLAAILGLIFISGIYQATLYSETPPTLRQEELQSRLDAELITVPLNTFVLTGNSIGSARDEDNVRHLVRNASNIWNQANITLEIKKISKLNLTGQESFLFLSQPREFIKTIEGYDYGAINVFLSRTLSGINGVAFPELRSVAVADKTTVYDFRALSHEVGHILGLTHVPDERERLMFQGANGTKLSLEEITKARSAALDKFYE